MNEVSNHTYFRLIVFAAIVYLLSVPVDIMEVDSAQYATIAREMVDRGEFLQVVDREVDYLDKPPFIFWITAFFYLIIGINEWAFKLPSIVFSILGIYSTFRLAKLFYGERTGYMAALILATTQGYFHFNNDVRTDTYLTNAVITCIWMIEMHLRTKSWKWLIGGFFFAGIAMLAKGPIGLMVPILAFGVHWVFKGEFRKIFRVQWLLGILITGIVLAPMLWGLYTQFDIQPDKIVNEKQNVSGIRFFFWEQSFGRLTGENVWKNDSGPFFFVHNIAWEFMPWTILLFFGLIWQVYQWIQRKELLKNHIEWISLAGFILPFVALSMSKYKLPHYIYVVLPLAAIFTASVLNKWIEQWTSIQWKILLRTQLFLMILIWILAAIIFGWVFPLDNPALILFALASFFIITWISGVKRYSFYNRFLFISVGTAIAVNSLLALHFYPKLLEYQAPGALAQWMLREGHDVNQLVHYGVGGRSMDVYTKRVVKWHSLEEINALLKEKQFLFIHTNEVGYNHLSQDELLLIEELKTAYNFPVTMLNIKFANPQTREQACEKRYLLKVKR